MAGPSSRRHASVQLRLESSIFTNFEIFRILKIFKFGISEFSKIFKFVDFGFQNLQKYFQLWSNKWKIWKYYHPKQPRTVRDTYPNTMQRNFRAKQSTLKIHDFWHFWKFWTPNPRSCIGIFAVSDFTDCNLLQLPRKCEIPSATRIFFTTPFNTTGEPPGTGI